MRRRAGEGDLARQHFVHHAAQRKEVAAPVEVAARGLLGAHVGRGANGHADLREHQTGRRGSCHKRLADTEVCDDGVAFVQQDVLRLDVAVDDVVPMRVVEGISHLHGDADRFVNGQRWAARETIRSVCPAMTGITKYKQPLASPES